MYNCNGLSRLQSRANNSFTFRVVIRWHKLPVLALFYMVLNILLSQFATRREPINDLTLKVRFGCCPKRYIYIYIYSYVFRQCLLASLILPVKQSRSFTLPQTKTMITFQISQRPNRSLAEVG